MRSALPAVPALLALAAALACPPPVKAANLIVNGGFESPDILDDTYIGGNEVTGWSGIAFLFDGGPTAGTWPSFGSSGPQYADFGNGPAEVYQDFVVPDGGAIREIRWADASSAVFGGGSYTVSLLALPAGTTVTETVFSIPAASGGAVVPWTAKLLDLPPSPVGPGRYRLLFVGTGMTGLDYLVDDVVVEAGIPSPTVATDAARAYAANAGWINLRPSATEGLQVNGTYLAGRAFIANLGWLDFGDGSPSNSAAYSQSAGDHGVNITADGTLTGYAFAANAGWINFGWAAPGTATRPRLNRVSGEFSGYAYSANLGWIYLGGGLLRHDVAAFPDTDLDGLPDAWEDAQFGNLADASGTSDYDGDGVSDIFEYQTGTNPRSVDSPVPARPSTIATDAGHLYAANAGWIDARPSARFGLKVGEYFLSGWLSAPNFGWIHVGNGTPLNGHAYANAPASPADYGVNLDATGALSGHAYGANIGWINFGWAEPNDPNRPRVDLTTGLFTGYAYSANLGWIALDSGALRTTALERLDTDADAMDDAWERENFGTIATAGVGTDADGDGQSDASEYIAGTDPQDNADRFRIISQTVANGITDVTLQFTSSETRRYRIEHTTQLTSGVWTDSPLGEFPPDAGVQTTRSFSLPSAATARFFRVNAVLPLATPAVP